MSITTTPGFLTSAVEHSEEIGNEVIRCSQMAAGDVLVLASTSGKNGAPVAVADSALKRGAKLIILTSSGYRNQKGNHSAIPNLWAFEDKALSIEKIMEKGLTPPVFLSSNAPGGLAHNRKLLEDPAVRGAFLLP